MRTEGLRPKRTKLRSSKYLNNLIEQDHRGTKSRILAMLGFKNFSSAAVTIAGVELLRRIHKDQFSLSRLRLKDHAAPALWNAVLAVIWFASSCYLHQNLKIHLQRQLHDSCRHTGISDRPKIRTIVRICIRIRELRSVERIEHVRPEVHG